MHNFLELFVNFSINLYKFKQIIEDLGITKFETFERCSEIKCLLCVDF